MTAAPAGVAALLALADQRLPSGGHVHSGGVEEAVRGHLLTDGPTLRAFLHRRLLSVGRVTAGLSAAAVGLTAATVGRLDAEADARTPSPAQRAASRAQGRGLLRLARAGWVGPHVDLVWADLGARPHHPLVLGCAARAAGLGAGEAALVAAYLAVTGPATAAQRLLGLDPVEVAVATLDLGAAVDAVAREAAAVALAAAPPTGWHALPDDGDPLLDLLAERHAARGDRLFAS
ncbi:urease accessory protein UreF [Kineosporia sp. R_H_3]|uniref:urease accessory protein UreF n=1 Tax=Kineosporia sp. R_H_3 TaxID=1961848 RepID=UPI000B4AF5CA|nr:urease accessory UreF family protein [Kineosporia sp. R_H_3]